MLYQMPAPVTFILLKKEGKRTLCGSCVSQLGWLLPGHSIRVDREGLSVDTEWPSKAGMQDALLWGDLATSEATHSYTQWVG